MGAMKDLWIKLEEERAAQVAGEERLKNSSFIFTFSRFLREVPFSDLERHCPSGSCGMNHLLGLIFPSNPFIQKVEDVLDTTCQCSQCKYVSRFEAFFPISRDRALLRMRVEEWLRAGFFGPPVRRLPEESVDGESGKPLGTRDPDKYLREQQDKQLRELFG